MMTTPCDNAAKSATVSRSNIAFKEAEPTPETVHYTVTLASADKAMGSVSPAGATEVDSASSFTATATAFTGYHFVAGTSNGSVVSADNPYTFTVSANIVLTATFEADSTEGIGEIAQDGLRVWVSNGCAVVEGADGEAVHVFDITGRPVDNRALPVGVYLVKVATCPALNIKNNNKYDSPFGYARPIVITG